MSGKRKREGGSKKAVPFSGECVLTDAELNDGESEIVLLRVPASFDVSSLSGLTIPLGGGAVLGGPTGLTVEPDDCAVQPPTLFIPGGANGRALPVDQRIRHALTLCVTVTPPPGIADATGSAAGAPPIAAAVALMPRPRVQQLGALRYRLAPIGGGSAPLLARGGSARSASRLQPPAERRKKSKDEPRKRRGASGVSAGSGE